MAPQKSVLIVGATGLVGSHCLQSLIKSDHYSRIIVLTRKEPSLDLSPQQKTRLNIVLVDFERLDDYQEQFEVDDVICCLGTTLKQAGSIKAFRKVDYDYCLKIAELAKAKNVDHFLIVTAVNANAKSKTYYSSTKGKLQDELKKLGFRRLSIFQPSLLLGERENFRFGEGAFGKASGLMNKLLPKAMNNFKAIEAEIVGKAMCGLAVDTETPETEKPVSFYHYDDMQELAKSIS